MKILSRLFTFSLFYLGVFATTPTLAFELIAKPDVLTIQLNNAPKVRSVFLPLFKEFEKETGIKVVPLRYIHDDEFKAFVTKPLGGEELFPDVLNGLNSQRLYAAVKAGVVLPVTDLWQENNWYDAFPADVTRWLSYNNEVYGVPYTKYSWGIFYQQSLVNQYGAVPQQWNEFVNYCVKLKKAGLEVFPASKKQPWIAAAWFEYFILRNFGYSFYQQILAGDISYHDERIQTALTQWKSLIDKGLFSKDYRSFTWEEYLPLFLRNKFSMLFMGSSIGRRIYDPMVLNNIQYVPFPKIANIPADETMPTTLFFISKRSKKIAQAKKFVTFFAQPKIQSIIAQHLFSSPVHKAATLPNMPIITKGHNMLDNAHQHSPFFDRDVKADFSATALPAFADFLFDGDITKLSQTLENARKANYSTQQKPIKSSQK